MQCNAIQSTTLFSQQQLAHFIEREEKPFWRIGALAAHNPSVLELLLLVPNVFPSSSH
jgi:hypothetical protein